MKKILSILLIALLLLVCTACGKGSGEKAQSKQQSTKASQAEKADANTIDLTKISSTMVYSELYNMMVTPDKYVGKTVILSGTYGVYEGNGRNYYVCEVQDATACCTQGLEFKLKDSYDYPEYSAESPKTIKVKGTFAIYDDNGSENFQLENASIIS